MEHLKIGCVVLAAGSARRFGENKLAAEVEGRLMKGCDVNGWPLDPRHPWNANENRHDPGRRSTPPQPSFNAKATDK